jgi:hypothetical protein
MLRFGSADGPVVVAAPALFEEGNRTRAFLVRILRLLAERGVASALPDLPGQSESLVPTSQARLADWRAAFAAAVRAQRRPAFVLALRGGALVDGDTEPVARFHVAPSTGASLMRDLIRVAQAGAREEGRLFDPAELDRSGPPLLMAGNLFDRALLAELRAAEPSPADRTVRLTSDTDPADLRLEGRPLWRAAEADVDEPLALSLADDVAALVRRCAA